MHGHECNCYDCRAERARHTRRAPELWRQLKKAAEGWGYDVPDMLEWAVENYGPDDTTKAVRRAVVALQRDELHDEAAALADEWAAW